ncbi:hypothetical protein SKAU_G00116190 [Synaphobranchus kaupii]|uniref:Uncharacterized protein n=1 Tax=Synaphobranchus kaupii TaxID=118154 RepID=A0A9Q1FMU0_SYNKA|nr:hypothetical protein SKAU_G00116190 [Synaphobranchus kaupii]
MQTAGPSGVGADTGRAVVEAEQGVEEASKTDKAARAPAGPSDTAEGPGQRVGAENTDIQTAGPSGVGADTGRAVVEAEQGEEEASKTDTLSTDLAALSEKGEQTVEHENMTATEVAEAVLADLGEEGEMSVGETEQESFKLPRKRKADSRLAKKQMKKDNKNISEEVTSKNMVSDESDKEKVVASHLGVRSVRFMQTVLDRWREALTEPEWALLTDYLAGNKSDIASDPFPELSIAPDLNGMEYNGPMLDFGGL